MRSLTSVAAALLLLFTACSGGGDNGTDPPDPTISLTVDRSSENVNPGGSFSLTGTLTRGGGYTGTVTFSVTGVPDGVTATPGAPSGTGTTSTVTIAVQVGVSVAPGTYPIVVRASGTGVTTATAQFTLVVNPVPDFGLAVSPAAAAIIAGASQGSITITINRTNFTGDVTLGMAPSTPAGITATFNPPGTSGTTSTMTLTVAANVPPADYPLTIQGSGAPGTRSVAFALTVQPPPEYAVYVTPSVVNMVQGQSRDDIAVALTRVNFGGAVTLALTGPVPNGVSAAFVPPAPTGDNSTMTITVGAATPVGTYTLQVEGTGAPGVRMAGFTLNVAAPGSFTLSMNTLAILNLAAGSSDASRTVTIARAGYDEAITLTAEGLPAGVSASFAPNPVNAATSVMTLTAQPGAAVGGPHTVTVRGTGPLAAVPANVAAIDLSATTIFTLNIVPPAVTSVSETFRGMSVSDAAWIAGGFGPVVVPGWPGKACLTAGTNTTASPVPGCGITVPDAPGLGVLRLTERTPAPAPGRVGFVAYGAPVSMANGLDITFHQAHYSPSAFFADGITFFITHGGVNFLHAGVPGSGLGYMPGGALPEPGVPQALIGIGFDVYGGFASNFGFYCPGDTGPGNRPNSVTIRGPGNDRSGYCMLSTTNLTLQGIQLHSLGSTRNDILTRIVVDPPSAPSPKVTVFLNGVQVVQIPAPAELIAAHTVKFGIAGSTGGLTDSQEIWNLTVNGPPAGRR
jgi:hypothetical protein